MVSLICSKNYLKMKKLFLLLLIIVCKYTIAQNTLNIFTHQGEKFILFLNGEQINLLPESKVKKENISATVQNVRIEFENKNNLQITENIYYEAGNEYTYIIKKKKVKQLMIYSILLLKILPPISYYVLFFVLYKDLPDEYVLLTTEATDPITSESGDTFYVKLV
jgi:hypothetical protein